MTNLPIRRMTLYKHGVGFFERRAKLDAGAVDLAFRVADMNDVLKSLMAIDWGGGQVLGIEYATPQSREERLAGCSIRLGDDRSLRDLLAGLRGRRVRLSLDQGESMAGVLLGPDELGERQPLATSLVSLLHDNTSCVQAVALGRVQSVEILDERGASDLRFFLETSLANEEIRQVTIRLTPGQHDLSVSYVAPAPTWRVSYRLAADPGASEGPRALLQGWGVFDNRLEEDLTDVTLSLVAGMPISFVYDLYTPFTPERPVVAEEGRAAAAPVEFAGAMELGLEAAAPEAMRSAAKVSDRVMAVAGGPRRAFAPGPAVDRQALAEAAPVAVTGEALGELFQYAIQTPVTVGRGHSAMVPIVSSDLGFHKDLLYNGSKMPAHPVATLRLKNETGLTLERGPVTVVEAGEYVGEAILPFTAGGGEVAIPYAVELGCKVREESGGSREIHALNVKGIYLEVEEWDVRWRSYQVGNSTEQAMIVLIEHPRTQRYDLFDTPQPKERTDEHLRFEIGVPAQGETTLRVKERRLTARREELRQQSAQGLQQYRQRGLLDQPLYDRLGELLRLWEQVADNEKRLAEVDKDREKVYKAQQQIQANMGALSATGKEGALRARYVEQLEGSENQLRALGQRDQELKAAVERLKAEIAAWLNA